MIIYSNTYRDYGESHQSQLFHDFDYKRKNHKKPKSIKSIAAKVSTSKSKTNKLKTLQKDNIQFLRGLGFEVK